MIFLVELGIFAYFYYKNQDPGNLILNQIGPVTAPTPLFGIYGTGTVGPLAKPMGVTVYNRNVFVTDMENRRVVVFDYDGNPLFAFGKQGADKGQFGYPYGITVDGSGQIYVADMYNGKISVFSQDGKFIKYFADSKEAGLQKPAGLFFFNNNIFVTDVGTHKVMAFDLSGKKVLEFGKKGSANGELLSPNCVTVTPQFIYVSDTANDRVVKYDRSGKFIAVNLGDNKGNPQASSFINTRGVAVDGRNILYIISNLTNQLWGFDEQGRRAFEPVGTVGQENNQFSFPNGIYIDNQGRIFIADTLNGRVMVYQN